MHANVQPVVVFNEAAAALLVLSGDKQVVQSLADPSANTCQIPPKLQYGIIALCHHPTHHL